MGVAGRVSRRALLRGAAAAAAASVTGCAADRRSPPGAAPYSTVPVTPSGAVSSAPAAGSDRDIAIAALKDENHALDVYRGLAGPRPDLRERLRPLVAVQRQHVDALAAAVDSTAVPKHDVVMPGRTAHAVVVEARRLSANRLADCQQVDDPSLASMLASMFAAHQVIAWQWAT